MVKKHPLVHAALERQLDEQELRQLQKMIAEIQSQMENCKILLGLESV